ncbi:MAG: hypothetical protein ACE5MI_02070 [Acidimicrobiia bacterium]
MGESGLPRRWALGVVALVSLSVLLLMNVWLAFLPTTPTGGDTGAHVLAPAFMRDELIPRGTLSGWSNSWYAGIPMYYFYFPLPALVIVLLDVFLPYGVAFKLVTLAGIAALPWATYYFVRCLSFGRTVSVVTAGAAGAFLVMESFTILGGNIPSTLAGEYSFSWSFAIGLGYLGTLIRSIDDRRLLPWAGVLLALTALAHVVTTIAFVLASLAVLVVRSGAGRTVISWVLGFSIAAFWALPLIVRMDLTADMGWFPLSGLDDVIPVEIWAISLLASVGAVLAWRRTPYSATILTLTFLWPLAGYFLLPQGRVWNGRFLPFWFFGLHLLAGVAVGWVVKGLARRLPRSYGAWWLRGGWVLLVALAAVWLSGLSVPGLIAPAWRADLWIVVAFGLIGLALTIVVPPRIDFSRTAPLLGVGVFVIAGLLAVNFISGWSRWNYYGYERKDNWGEYEALMAELDELPPGRVQWEGNSDLNRYGTPMALMLTDYWTDGHPSQEGLFFESSITTPFHFINSSEMSLSASNPVPGLRYNNLHFERGLRHLDLYGVRYYVAFTEEAQEEARSHPDLNLLFESEPFVVFELPPSDLVEVATHVPAVYEAPRQLPLLGLLNFSRGPDDDGEQMGFQDFALDWYDDLDNLDRLVTAGGPASWPRITTVEELPAEPIAGGGTVSNVQVTDDRVSFETTAVGLPHLVKVSYFPNWTAYGAEGPYRATPSLMVVVPTTSHVELRFEPTWAEWTGRLLTLAALVTLAGWAVVLRRERV